MWPNFRKRVEKGARGAGSSKRDMLALTLSVIIVLFVLNFLSSRHFLRVDLTEGDEYTLSASTKNILKNLDDVVNIRLYFSKKLPPALLRLKRDVDDMLSEYRTYAGSKLNVQYIDPQETPQLETQTRMMGIPPVQVNVIEKDKQELVKLYLGIAVVHEDRKEVLPVVQGAANLEYDLTSAILTVSRKDKPAVKWLLAGEGGSYNNIKELLKRRYEVKDISADGIELDPANDALLVLAMDGDITDSQLFEIDQYLMKGGKILAMVDRVEIGSNLQTSLAEVENILGWLKNNGIDVKDKLLLDRSNTHAAFSGGYITYHVPYPYWVKVTASGFDEASPVVSDLDSLILPWVSPLEVGADNVPGVEYTVLARSSPFNNPVGLDASLLPEDAQRLVGKVETEPKPLVIFAAGRLTSSFGGGKKQPPKGAEAVAVADDAQLMAIGDSRFVQDNFLMQFKANSIFFENAVDFMAMGKELIGIRSKGVTDRPIEGLTSSGTAVTKYLNILGAPIILVAIGLVILFLRRQKRQVLKSVYKLL